MEMHIPMHVVTEEVLTRLPAKPLMSFSKLLSEMPIPMHVVTEEILTRLPAKSLMRFKCDVNDQHSSVTLSLVPDANSDTPSSSSFVVDLTIPRMRGGYICQNLRGLIMCYDNLWKTPLIFNPAIRQLVTLPPAFKSSTIGTISYYFGHDPVTNRRGEGSWGKANPLPPRDFIPHTAARGGVCIDGVIYYLGWTAADECMLVSFRIRSHKFKMIQVPLAEDLPPPPKMKNVCLVEYSGKATVVDQTNLRDKGMLDLWALEDAANKKWSSKRLVLKPCQLDFVTNVEFVVREHRELFYVLPRDDVMKIKDSGMRKETCDY
ncbi:F-box protein [Raphanus sativus]|nr:F-box protein [Raphanus sativus]KAJ4870049.1 F-box protein [Raphanus sativus]